MNEVNELKMVLRSMLIATKHGLNRSEILKNYKVMEGREIPVRQLGFSSPSDLFRSLTDVMEVRYVRGEEVYVAVDTPQTAHITKMVNAQKVQTGGKKRRPVQTVRTYQSPRNSAPVRHHTSPAAKYIPPHKKVTPLMLMPAAPTMSHFQKDPTNTSDRRNDRVIPASIQNNIRLLVESEPDGILGSTLHERYTKQFGAPLDFNSYKYSTLLEMLKDMTDVVQVQQRPGGGYKILSIRQSRQNIRPARPPPPDSDSDRQKTKANDDRKRHKSSGSDHTVPVHIMENIRKVLEQYPDGMLASAMLVEYRATTNSELNPLKLGYSSVVELMAAIPSVVTIKRPVKNGDWILFDARTHPATDSSEVNITPARRNWRDDLIQLFNKYSDGIHMDELPRCYKDEFNEELDPPSLGFPSLMELLQEIRGDIVDRIEHVSRDKVLIHPCPQRRSYQMAPPVSRFPAIARPDDYVRHNERFKPQPIPDDLMNQRVGWFELRVCHVLHPAQICIQLSRPDTTGALEDLMDELEYLYKQEEGDMYVVPDELLREGMICAAVYPDDNMDYHRCVVTNVLEGGLRIEVFYVDYGGTSIVERKHVRLLQSDFMALPAQAIDAKLHGIKPVNKNTGWTIESKQCLLHYTMNREVLGSIRHVEEKERVLHLCLCDTNGDSDVHINDKLVEEGHALFTNEFEEATSGGGNGQLTKSGSSATLDSDTTRRYIKLVVLTDLYSFHLINLDRVPYVAGPEIAAFLWPENQLMSMLRQKRMKIEHKLAVTREDYPELFNEFKTMNISCLKDKDLATLYRLDTVPRILETFQHPEKSFIEKLVDLYSSFNPDDAYWLQGDGDETDESESFEAFTSRVSLTDLQMTLKILQFQRQGLVTKMAEQPSPGLVDEMKEVEIKMNSVSKKIKSMQEEGHVSNVDGMTESERYTVDCVRVQYRSPQRPGARPKDDVTDAAVRTTSSTVDAIVPSFAATSITSDKVPSVNRVAPMPKQEESVVINDVTKTTSSVVTSLDNADTRQIFTDAITMTRNVMTQNNNEILVGQQRMAQNLAQFTYPQPGMAYMPAVPPFTATYPSQAMYQPAVQTAQNYQQTLQWVNSLPMYQNQRPMPTQQQFYAVYSQQQQYYNPGLNWPPNQHNQ